MEGGARGGPNSQQAHDVITTSMQRNDVASTSFPRRVPFRFLINQCQIITFLILKNDIIENSRIGLRGIVLPVQVGGLLGGPKGMLGPPPLSNYWGGLAPPAPPPPSSYAHTCDSTAGSKKIPFSKPVCRSTVPVDQTTVFENFRKYYENPIKSVPISLSRHAPV